MFEISIWSKFISYLSEGVALWLEVEAIFTWVLGTLHWDAFAVQDFRRWLWYIVHKLNCPVSASHHHWLLFFYFLFFFLDIWFSFICNFFNELHRFIWIFLTKIIIFISDTIPHLLTKFVKHLELNIFKVLFLK